MSGDRDSGAVGEEEAPATVVSAGNRRRAQVRAAKGALKPAPSHVGFTEERRATFLSHFAATCNATASAAAAGVSTRTVYNWRRDNPAFREAWHAALDQGYARLEAAIVRRSSDAIEFAADEGAAEQSEKWLDPRNALAVLEAYRRHAGGARTGAIIAQPYDLDEVRDRLAAKMRALGMLGEADGSSARRVCDARLSPGQAAPLDPSTIGSSANGPPPPDDLGEES